MGMHMQANRLMGRICELHRWNGLICHDERTKFCKMSRMDSQTQKASLFLFFQH
jgi:hypothetical protein